MAIKANQKGITLYITLIVTGAMILVAVAVANLAARELSLANISKDSQVAFFMSDSGTECALYLDLKVSPNPFATTTSPIPSVSCFGQSTTPSRQTSGNFATSTFSFNQGSYCVALTVVKGYSGGTAITKIESRGYNTGTASGGICTSSSGRRVERAIRVSY